MRQIGIVTDSSSDLLSDVADLRGIVVAPLTIQFGDEALVDGVDLDPTSLKVGH